MYGRVSGPGMRPYPPRVRQDLDVPPSETSRRTPGAGPLVEGGRGEDPRSMELELGKRWIES